MTSTPSAVLEAAEPPVARRRLHALWLGTLFRPRSTLAYLREHGGWSWLWPVATALLLTLALRLVSAPIERAQAQAAFEAMQAQMEQAGVDGEGGVTFSAGPMMVGPVGDMSSSGLPTSSPLASFGLPLLGVVWNWALAGVLLFGLVWLLGGRPRLGAMLRMSGWALLPSIARLAVAIGFIVATGRIPATGLNAATLSPDSVVVNEIDSQDGESSAAGGPMITSSNGGVPGTISGPSFLTFWRMNFLQALDIYTLWSLALLTIGVSVTAAVGWLRAGATTVLYWVLSLALAALVPMASFWLMSLTGSGNGVIMR